MAALRGIVLLPSYSTPVALALGLLLACQNTAAQQSAPSDKFSSRTELVLIPVVVTDKSGVHVAGLKKDDFFVRENGKERALSTFEEIVTQPGQWDAVPRTNAEFSNLVRTPENPPRVSIVVVDTINTPRLAMAYAREALLKFAAQSATRREPVSILALTRGGVRLLHDFTTDPKALEAALEQIRSAQPAIDQGSIDAFESTVRTFESVELAQICPACFHVKPGDPRIDLARIRDAAQYDQDFVGFQQRVAIVETMEGLQQIAATFARIPGRKSLVWATAGFPFTINDNTNHISRWFANNGIKDVLPMYQRTWQLLNSANISVYPVDVRGFSVGIPSLSGNYTLGTPELPPPGTAAAPMLKAGRDRAEAEEADTIGTMQTFAEMTGGRAYYHRNDLERCFQEATDDSSSYYMLGYYLEKNPKAGWHKLDVKLRAARGQVRARNGFFVGEDAYNLISRRRDDFRLALRSPLSYTELGLAVRIASITPAGENRRVNFRISITPSPRLVDFNNKNHVALEYVAVAMRADGSIAAETDHRAEGLLKQATAEAIATDGLHRDSSLEMPPGEYTLKVIVRDNTHGLVGSASGPITVR